MQQVTLKILKSEKLCQKYASYSSSKLFCAISLDNQTNSNACYGDSGSPLFYRTKTKWFIHGLTSFVLASNDGTCDSKKPSYFTRIYLYLDWINETIKLLENT